MSSSDASATAGSVTITFYDANHCPGAAIVVAELPNKVVHVHTGDFRYHERMQTYTLLRDAAVQQRIESILLDTTYAHPKHDFGAQDVVVNSIAQQVKAELTDGGDTLILLECYNIGKEKILWAAANACQQLIHVSEKKWNLLECLTAADDETAALTGIDADAPACHLLIQKCTRDPNETNIHVVPMSTSGAMWPFFQPNYESIAEYVERQVHKKYAKVVSFIPTGWAEATNWNKKHAATKMVRRGLEIEIRLVAYSEHSSFKELQDFVKFTKPMRVVATVYKDETDKRAIEARFRVDGTRAKKRFLEQMTKQSSASVLVYNSKTESVTAESPSCSNKRQVIEIESEISVLTNSCNDELAPLIAMGFDTSDAQKALSLSRGNVESAVTMLLHGDFPPSQSSQANVMTSPDVSKVPKGQTPTKMTAFFKRKGK